MTDDAVVVKLVVQLQQQKGPIVRIGGVELNQRVLHPPTMTRALMASMRTR